ncbi:LAGLIDADG family homing endonuclease [Lyngbya sp. PCC 8106]|uniref:LAGLIDADG family homing endonuclease n=1 Tax=Lyngbya sp. (strain PCC 8106) TaxID=313612 RepID=UPI0000EAC6C3|nr:LAGLIDADG family homing endonuclease [Lyngbya sp. PCC 8106]EAW34680.1 hypothetical protein L8106_25220 [Lyngbya sp. PCC 8106]
MSTVTGTEPIVNPLQNSNLNKKGLCDYVINIASGCLHGCTFCLVPETLILYSDLTWRKLEHAKVGDVLLGFDENPTSHVYRFFRKSTIEAIQWSKQEATKIVTDAGEVIATSNHGWLNCRGKWLSTQNLTTVSQDRKDGFSTIKSIGLANHFAVTDDYKLGYIAGMTEGDGTFRFDPNEIYKGDYTPYWRVALCDFEPLERLVEYLLEFDISVSVRPYYKGNDNHREAKKVETRSQAQCEKLFNLLAAPLDTVEYHRGFISGFFDAEGSFNQSLRLSQKILPVLHRVQKYAKSFGFSFQLEKYENCCFSLRLLGGFSEVVRFFSTFCPAITRKSEKMIGGALKGIKAAKVIDKIPMGLVDVVDIQTSTHTFFANGLATHNCYVPSTPAIRTRQAQLQKKGVNNPQMDWGQYLLIREDIPEKLNKILERKRTWNVTPSGKGVVLLCSGTDPYQNKQTAEITRRVVQILSEKGKRVRILTRSPLWINDLDILINPNITVGMSLPYLDDQLSRQIEPQAPPPSKRYEALLKGRQAGCRLYVAMAPTPPSLTRDDFEKYLEKMMQLEPEVIFWEPINARGTNGKRMLAAGLEWVNSVMTKRSWAEDFLRQWDDMEAAAIAVGCKDRLHIWPDPGLKKYVDDPNKVGNWLYHPTVEKWD